MVSDVPPARESDLGWLLRAFPLDYADEPALQFRAPRTHR